MADTFVRWPELPVFRRKSLWQKLRHSFLFITPVAFLVFMLYLIYGKFYKTPLKEIEEYLEKQEFFHAFEVATEEAKTNNSLKLRYLMLAVVAAEGLSHPTLEKLEKDLAEKDTSGIYLKESFYKRLSTIPQLKNFPRLLLNYQNYFPHMPDNDILPLLQKHVLSEVEWNLPNSKEDFFNTLCQIFPHLVYEVRSDRVYLRRKGNTGAEPITLLPKGTKVIKRFIGQEEVIGQNRAQWFFIYSETGHSGWIYGAYLKN